MHPHLNTPTVNNLLREFDTLFDLKREIRSELDRHSGELAKFVLNVVNSTGTARPPTAAESGLLFLAALHTVTDVACQDRQRQLEQEIDRLNRLNQAGAKKGG